MRFYATGTSVFLQGGLQWQPTIVSHYDSVIITLEDQPLSSTWHSPTEQPYFGKFLIAPDGVTKNSKL